VSRFLSPLAILPLLFAGCGGGGGGDDAPVAVPAPVPAPVRYPRAWLVSVDRTGQVGGLINSMILESAANRWELQFGAWPGDPRNEAVPSGTVSVVCDGTRAFVSVPPFSDSGGTLIEWFGMQPSATAGMLTMNLYRAPTATRIHLRLAGPGG
jgi:hypothetical protein